MKGVNRIVIQMVNKILRRVVGKFYNYQLLIKNNKIKKKIKIIIDEISVEPTKYLLHEKLANYYYELKMYLPSIAECRSSITLGNIGYEVFVLLISNYMKLKQNNAIILLIDSLNISIKKKVLSKISDIDKVIKEDENNFLLNYDHNQFFRINSLADRIKKIKKKGKISVLDVGGGIGLLSVFLPNVDYMLVEPTINGISNSELHFLKNRKFDVVVACHVLEHIEEDKKMKFLDSICSLSKNKVILLNPFRLENNILDVSLKLIYEMTEAPWAKEHLECRLPSLHMVYDYANKHSYRYESFPNGTFSTTISHVFLSYFASSAKKRKDLMKVNYLFNKELIERLDNSNVNPTAFLVEFTVN